MRWGGGRYKGCVGGISVVFGGLHKDCVGGIRVALGEVGIGVVLGV